MKILILSSRNETHSANFGKDVCSALREAGHEVTYNFQGAEKILYKLQHFGDSWIGKQIQRAIDKYTSMRGLPLWKLRGYYEGAGYKFFIGDESRNVYSPKKLVKKIGNNYDLVIFMFFMDFFNMMSVEAVCKSLNCPVLMVGIDDYLMTGGCYYCNDCDNYKIDCRFCPAFGGKEHTLAFTNALLKKRILSSYDIKIMVNSWMKQSFEQSSIIDKSKLLTHSFILDEDYYKPDDIYKCREKLGISSIKTIVISMRYNGMERKGCKYGLAALEQYVNKLDTCSIDKILLVTFGDKIKEQYKFDVLNMGYVSSDTLRDVYCASTMFLSPSTIDAGPSTVNQSICCGTPVVAFEIGTAIDVIENGISGYRAKYKNVEDYSRGIEMIASLNDNEYAKLRISTREMGVRMNSKKSFAKFIEDNFTRE